MFLFLIAVFFIVWGWIQLLEFLAIVELSSEDIGDTAAGG
jgi:predicted secreted protein